MKIFVYKTFPTLAIVIFLFLSDAAIALVRLSKMSNFAKNKKLYATFPRISEHENKFRVWKHFWLGQQFYMPECKGVFVAKHFCPMVMLSNN